MAAKSFTHQGMELVYEVFGRGERHLILLPGLLMNRKLHYPLAKELAAKGNHVILLDPLGHGDSDRPRDMWRYSMSILAEEVVALMDHLKIEQAVVGGPSMGANIALETAVFAPERVKGMVIEMPVLDNAIPAVAVFFTPLLYAFTFGRTLMKPVNWAASKFPRGLNYFLDLYLDSVAQDPGPSGAVLQGMFFGRAAPPRHMRKEIEAPTMVLGHPRDFIHPFSDAQMLAQELPHGRLVEATSIAELRARPERLTKKISDFLDECWQDQAKSAGKHIRAVS